MKCMPPTCSTCLHEASAARRAVRCACAVKAASGARASTRPLARCSVPHHTRSTQRERSPGATRTSVKFTHPPTLHIQAPMLGSPQQQPTCSTQQHGRICQAPAPHLQAGSRNAECPGTPRYSTSEKLNKQTQKTPAEFSMNCSGTSRAQQKQKCKCRILLTVQAEQQLPGLQAEQNRINS